MFLNDLNSFLSIGKPDGKCNPATLIYTYVEKNKNISHAIVRVNLKTFT